MCATAHVTNWFLNLDSLIERETNVEDRDLSPVQDFLFLCADDTLLDHWFGYGAGLAASSLERMEALCVRRSWMFWGKEKKSSVVHDEWIWTLVEGHKEAMVLEMQQNNINTCPLAQFQTRPPLSPQLGVECQLSVAVCCLRHWLACSCFCPDSCDAASWRQKQILVFALRACGTILVLCTRTGRCPPPGLLCRSRLSVSPLERHSHQQLLSLAPFHTHIHSHSHIHTHICSYCLWDYGKENYYYYYYIQ